MGLSVAGLRGAQRTGYWGKGFGQPTCSGFPEGGRWWHTLTPASQPPPLPSQPSPLPSPIPTTKIRRVYLSIANLPREQTAQDAKYQGKRARLIQNYNDKMIWCPNVQKLNTHLSSSSIKSALNRPSKFRLVLASLAQKGHYGGDGAENWGTDIYHPFAPASIPSPAPMLLARLSALLGLGQDTFYFWGSNW